MIDSPKSATVRRVAALRDRKARTETGLFLVEGPQAVREALGHVPDAVVELYLTSDALSRHEDLASAASAADIDVQLASDAALAAMTDTQHPQGVVAVAMQQPVALRDVFRAPLAVLRDGTGEDTDGGPARLVVILDEVRDPGNVGTIIRAADAAGADAVVLTGSSVDPYNPKVVRATTGSLFHVGITTGVPLDAAVQRAREHGLQVLAADMAGESLPTLGSLLALPTAWLFGNEAHGISVEARRFADCTVAVPIYGAAESLNLATAASVCLYASAFAGRATT